MLFGGEEKIEFEGIDAQVNRYYISKREGSSHELPILKYSNENLANLFKNIKSLNLILRILNLDHTSKFAKWLIQLNFLSVLLTELENVSSSHDDAIALELHFKFGPKLKENITAITNLLHNDRLSYWAREGVIFMASGKCVAKYSVYTLYFATHF
ncbi:unnamed protein product [Rhizophagus irregularis]|nr:unnamed protein product [Rhizophagus irregularis]